MSEVPAMPTVKLRFPGGRYHATPWGHHVNEGLIEWPPSPWRLLRAFLACGFSSQGWVEVPALAQRLIDKLAAVLPLYRLPAASAAHTRHFMPVGSLKDGREQTTLVFDSWANVGDGELFIRWPCELDADEMELLGKLASSLGYLGRSESWVEAQLTDEEPGEWNAVPCVENEHPGPGWEQVSLMAAIAPAHYDQWHAAQVQEALRPFQDQRQTQAVKKKQTQAIEPFPPNLVSCLTKDTSWWKGFGWSQPPGAQRVLYWRRNDVLQVGVPPAPHQPSIRRITTFLLAITTPSGRRSALPPITRALPQAENLHRALVGVLGQGRCVDCPELTGKDADGQPLRSGHVHAHILPACLTGNGDNRIDHFIIHAKMGLGGQAQQAIRNLKRTWTKGGIGDLQIAVAGHGELDNLRLPDKLRTAVERVLGPRHGSRVWTSATPFVPPRFIKRTGRNTLLGQLNAELASRGLPAVERVEILPELTRELRHFVRHRSRGGVWPYCDVGYGLRITLADAVNGPLTLGYAAHFGLGIFHAIDGQ
ncbi:MAG TPA: type I-U CRISPR-associated protein Csb2 [Gemmataceae bacterium]|nr:type I-U CRISPR-associated protein Csb2 [Gemmataceae bacterium]